MSKPERHHVEIDDDKNQDLKQALSADLELTPSELADLEAHPLTVEELFELYDDDCSGTIDINELPELLRALDFAPTQAKCKALMEQSDTSGDGKLKLEELEALVEAEASDIPVRMTEAEIRQSFLEFDADGSGKISLSELRAALTSEGEPMEEHEVDALVDMTMKKADVDHDGELDYDEFAQSMQGRRPGETPPPTEASSVSATAAAA